MDTPKPIRPAGLNDDGLGKAAIAWFNDRNSWEDVTDGAIQKGRFCATWRNEKTASVQVDPDGNYACDYGKHSNFPKKLDRFGVWCLIHGHDQRTELKRLIAEYRSQERIAS